MGAAASTIVPTRKAAPHLRLPPEAAASLGTALRHMRVSAGLTQEELAASSGASVQLVRRIEAGTSNPTLGTVAALAAAMNASIADLATAAAI